jgi:hypothetical protein
VSLHKGTIMKGMLPKLKSSKYILVYRSSLGNSWFTHVHQLQNIYKIIHVSSVYTIPQNSSS